LDCAPYKLKIFYVIKFDNSSFTPIYVDEPTGFCKQFIVRSEDRTGVDDIDHITKANAINVF
jgi:hypothetical protein